jgi:hypothetical protein
MANQDVTRSLTFAGPIRQIAAFFFGREHFATSDFTER